MGLSTRGWRTGDTESTWGTRDGRQIPPYLLEVDPQAMAGASELQQARNRERATYLWIRALSVAIIVFVAANSFHARPAPGGHGQALAVTVTLIALCGVTMCSW